MLHNNDRRFVCDIFKRSYINKKKIIKVSLSSMSNDWKVKINVNGERGEKRENIAYGNYKKCRVKEIKEYKRETRMLLGNLNLRNLSQLLLRTKHCVKLFLKERGKETRKKALLKTFNVSFLFIIFLLWRFSLFHVL